MLDTGERVGAEPSDVDVPAGDDRRAKRRRSTPGRRTLTGWALGAVLCLAGSATALGVTPQPILDLRPHVAGARTVGTGTLGFVADGSVADGSVADGSALGVATAPTMHTVTAPSLGIGTSSQAVPGSADGLGFGVAVPTPSVAGLRRTEFTTAAPDGRATIAIKAALAELGLPYQWGGNGPTNGDAGFDCSGLTTFSYAVAGVRLPRTAHTQYNSGPHVPADAPLQPGDLVFYGTPLRVHHVGMYLGDGRMVNAPTFGRPVQIAFYRYRGDDYLGATRPAAVAGSLTPGVLPYADPVPVPSVPVGPLSPAQDPVFRAPTASLPPVLPRPGDPALLPEAQSAARSIAESDAAARSVPAVQPASVQTSSVQTSSVRTVEGQPDGGTAAATSSAPVTTTPAAPSTGSAAAATTSPSGATSSSTAPQSVTTAPPTSSTTAVKPTTAPPTAVTTTPPKATAVTTTDADPPPTTKTTTTTPTTTKATTTTTTTTKAATKTTESTADDTKSASAPKSTAKSAPKSTAASKSAKSTSASKSSTSSGSDDGGGSSDG